MSPLAYKVSVETKVVALLGLCGYSAASRAAVYGAAIKFIAVNG
jgi:hypothetical protein